MAETSFTHPTYKFVDEKDADAIAWAFVDTEHMKKIPFKFPEIKPDELRIKVTYTGLCRSDGHTVRNEWGECAKPIAPGHEIVGEVILAGSDVKDFKVGDNVGFGPQRACCGKCDFCQNGNDHLCRGSVDQWGCYGDLYWGGYATQMQQPANFFFKIPEGLPLEKIPPLFCAGVTTYRPISLYAKAGDEIAVLGVGGLGHLAVQYAKAWGCKVTAFSSTKDKEKFIKDLGADRVVTSDLESIKKEAGKFHLVLNTLPLSKDYTEYVRLARPMGYFCQLGLPEFSSPCDLNPEVLIMNCISLVGSLIGSRKEQQEMLEFSTKHNIMPICEQYDFEEFPKAYEKLWHGRPFFRCVVDCTKADNKH